MNKRELVKIGIASGQFPQIVYKYNAFNDHLVDSLKGSYLWFSNARAFNDPFDCNIVIDASGSIEEFELFLKKSPIFSGSEDEIIIKAQQLKYDPELFHRINAQKSKLIAEKGVACFSNGNDNILMWSYYTMGHKGVCLGYDLSKIISEDMTPFSVRYSKNYPVYNYITKSGDHDIVVTILGVKSKKWKHEKEFRIVSIKPERNEIPRSALKSVIFGYNAEESTKSIILDILNAEYDASKIFIGSANLKERSYKLEIK